MADIIRVRLERVRAVGALGRLGAQREPLRDAEAVLLVHDREAEARELGAVLNHRVRADHELCGAERGRFERGAFLLGLETAREPRDRDAERFEPSAQLARVLFRQQLGRRHQRGLVARIDGLCCGQGRHHGLAAADVALQQTLHRMRLVQIERDLAGHAPLRARERERQRAEQARDERVRIGARGHRGRGARAAFFVRALERELLREQDRKSVV